MKRIHFKSLFLLSLIALFMASCEQTGKTTQTDGVSQEQVSESSQAMEAGSNSTAGKEDIVCTIDGVIDHDNWIKSQSSQVSFTRFPNNLSEFEKVRNQLAVEPQGAVALQVMAFELYRRNASDGEKALKLNNTDVNCTQTLRQLKEMMNTKDAYYARPYLAAALLKGATPDNAYTPSSPYTVQIRVNPTMIYQDSEFLNGTVIYLQVDSKGWDTNWRGVEVVKPSGSEYYVVSNCPALYTQCKKIQGSWNELL